MSRSLHKHSSTGRKQGLTADESPARTMKKKRDYSVQKPLAPRTRSLRLDGEVAALVGTQGYKCYTLDDSLGHLLSYMCCCTVMIVL